MKTSIKTLLAAVLTIITLGAAAPAVKAENNEAVTTTLNNVKNIRKIVVSGNVELVLIQDSKESVKVYDNYYAKNALIQQEGGELRISSYTKEKLTVIAHVNQLTSITASNNASVVTKGQLNLIGLDVFLKDNATADINANVVNLYTSVNDNATLKLAGKATEYASVMSATSKVGMEQFVAENTTIRSVAPVYSAKIVLSKESIDEIAADF